MVTCTHRQQDTHRQRQAQECRQLRYMYNEEQREEDREREKNMDEAKAAIEGVNDRWKRCGKVETKKEGGRETARV